MEKKSLKPYLLAPLLVSAFLLSNLAKADENTRDNQTQTDSSVQVVAPTVSESSNSVTETTSSSASSQATTNSALTSSISSTENVQIASTDMVMSKDSSGSVTAEISTENTDNSQVSSTNSQPKQIVPFQEESKVSSSEQDQPSSAKSSSTTATPSVKQEVKVKSQDEASLSATNTQAQSAAVTTLAMYRLYNPNSGEHFYTSNGYEKVSLVKLGWRDENVAWYAPTKGEEVYRLYNPNAGDHHYTVNKGEMTNLSNLGWRYEGIAWYSAGTIAMYRLYNPNAKSGSHHYTASKSEVVSLTKLGWRYEDVAWYGMGSMDEVQASSTANTVANNSKPVIEVTNYQKDKGTLTVVVKDTAASKPIKQVRVAAWSELNQSNIYWYTSDVITNGSTLVTVNERNHKYIKGSYTVHTYVDYLDKSVDGFVVGTYDLQAEKVGAAAKGDYDVFNKVIYLDAGHGGYDPGASYFGQSEKNLTLDVQKRVQAKLEAAGYTVITSRDTDTFVDLLDRSKKVNSTESDIFISIHFNAGASSASGIETYYYEYYPEYPSRINQTYHNNSERLTKSRILAEAIQAGTTTQTGARNNGVKRNTFAVLRETTAPAVLLELGYISNAAEFQRINTTAYRDKLADGIVSGINNYYKTFDV
ncbi:N-acetylmuramoyl-L-alanine amidase [Streptococcus caballi]